MDRTLTLRQTTIIIAVSFSHITNKQVMTGRKECMDPSMLNIITVLDESSDMWDAEDVQAVG